MRVVTARATAFVAAQEGLRLRAYQDGAGVWTLGYGHTAGVRAGDHCTRAQARQWLQNDLTQAADRLGVVLPAPVIEGLTEEQWTALLSFAFNVGVKRHWTVWRAVKDGDPAAVTKAMMAFVNAGGRPSAGLQKRRTAETALWLGSRPAPRATFLISAAGAAASAAPMVDQVSQAIQPYAERSAILQKVLGLLALLGAALAVAGLVLIWLRKHEAAP